MLQALIGLLLLTYPLLVWYGLDRYGPLGLGVLLTALLITRFLLLGRLRSPAAVAAVAAAIVFLIALWATDDATLLKAYPVAVNLVLLGVFAASLVRPPTVIERGLRLAGREVPTHAPPYLWWVTLAWCGFFLFNGAVAAWTAFAAPLSWWALYNGLLSYGLIAAFFGLEWLVRGVYRRRVAAREPPGD